MVTMRVRFSERSANNVVCFAMCVDEAPMSSSTMPKPMAPSEWLKNSKMHQSIDEVMLTHLEQQALHDPPVIALRIRLSRALNDGVEAMRNVISILDEQHHVTDAARVATLLAFKRSMSRIGLRLRDV
jgi:hypothetical protein